MHVELEPPAAVSNLGSVIEPAVSKVLGRLTARALEGNALSIDDLLLAGCDPVDGLLEAVVDGPLNPVDRVRVGNVGQGSGCGQGGAQWRRAC